MFDNLNAGEKPGNAKAETTPLGILWQRHKKSIFGSAVRRGINVHIYTYEYLYGKIEWEEEKDKEREN